MKLPPVTDRQQERHLDDVLRRLGDAPVPVEDADAAALRRHLIVGRLATTIHEAKAKRDRSRRRIRGLVALSLAASIAAVFGSWRMLRNPGAESALTANEVAGRLKIVGGALHSVVVIHEGNALVAPDTHETMLDSGDEVRTGLEGSAMLELSNAASVELSTATNVQMVEPEIEPSFRREWINLHIGRVLVHVPKLVTGRTFGVHAPDVDVVVHGTSFEVVVREGDGGEKITAVAVTEGIVSVHHKAGEAKVAAGERWISTAPFVVSSAAAVDANDAEDPVAIEPLDLDPLADHPPVRADQLPAARQAPAPLQSKLAEQNRLFQTAMAARQRGDDAAAIRLLDTLLSRHPNTPLAQEARVERMRALQRKGDTEAAAREAQRYLEEHRDGFAREEAKDLVAAPSASGSTFGKPR